MAGYVSNNLPTSKCYFLKKIYLPCLKTVKLSTCSFYYHFPPYLIHQIMNASICKLNLKEFNIFLISHSEHSIYKKKFLFTRT